MALPLDAWQSGHVDFYPIDCIRRAGVCQSPNFDVCHRKGVQSNLSVRTPL